MDALVEELTRTGLAAGLAAVGVAPAAPFDETRRHLEERRDDGLHGGMQFTYRNPARSTDPGRALPGARALIVGAYAYARAPAAGPPESNGPAGRVARYSWTDFYAVLRAALEQVAGVLDDRGYRTRILADDNALVDREAAFRAGLGTYGKNTMLLLHGDRGSEFVLGAVVTDAPLPPAAPPGERSACGPCQRCLPACPTGAFVAAGVLDARRCLAWLLQAEGDFPREHRAALGDRLYGCDECQAVCPPNRLEIRRRPPSPAPADAEPTVAVLDLLDEPDDDALLARHGRWYIARRQARHLRRNALVVLGNAGVGAPTAGVSTSAAGALTAGVPTPGAATGARIVATLTRYLDPAAAGADPMLRAHAAWAAARLGRADLVDPADPVTAAEVGALATPR